MDIKWNWIWFKTLQRGITYINDPPIGANVSSRLFISSNSAINNNTEVICKAIDSISNSIQLSQPANLTIQGECPMKVCTCIE